uniref:Beta-hexosaminidase n=1 Tax=Corethrella appendiculata TaxID=1370023 RepID=U5ETX4_9DIPT
MKLSRILTIFIVLVVKSVFGYIVDPGPVVKATKGEIWPKPTTQVYGNTYSVIRPNNIKFQAVNTSCDLLEKAFDRYHKIINITANSQRRRLHTYPMSENATRHTKRYRTDPAFDGYLEIVDVNLKSACDHLPYLGMDEAYDLEVREGRAEITSYSVWGILRGLESFTQAIFIQPESGILRINSTMIYDRPRFSHRGLLVDTSRHFISVCKLIKILDGMAFNKLNVFHWHIVDDHSFPYQSITFPELSEKGAFHPEGMIYSQEDVQRIIEEARLRGIRVLVEFDTPGHTRSWGNSHPEILTPCYGSYEGKYGPLDPTKDTTYEFLRQLFREIVNVFPEQYIHLGGDEVGFECWESNPDIREYMKVNRIFTFEALEEKFIQKIVDDVQLLNHSSIVWQEVFSNGVKLPKGTVVHVWTGNRQLLLNSITSKGLPALLSSCWYLDHLSTGGDWRKYYNCDPHDFNGSDEQKRLVYGGEACMWAEVVDDHNILSRIFPRVSATAEKLWSQQDVTDIDEAARRLEEHTCRMIIRGIPAQPPNGPGFCL